MNHAVTFILSAGARVTDNHGLPLFAFGLFPQGGLPFYLPATLYDTLGDAMAWIRAAWKVVAEPWGEAKIGPGWWGDLGQMWEQWWMIFGVRYACCDTIGEELVMCDRCGYDGLRAGYDDNDGEEFGYSKLCNECYAELSFEVQDAAEEDARRLAV